MTNQDAGIGDIFGSMFGLAAAGAKFTLQQMENAMSMFTDSQGVMNRVRNSMDKISNAMGQEAESLTAESLTGRKA